MSLILCHIRWQRYQLKNAVPFHLVSTVSDLMIHSVVGALCIGGRVNLLIFEGNFSNTYVITHLPLNCAELWSAICFKIMTWYTCRFFPCILALSLLLHDICAFFCHVYLRSFLFCGVFIPKYMTIFLPTRIYNYIRTKKPIYMR